jgi:hypothetical protein
MFFILFYQCISLQCLLTDAMLKNPCSISLYNLNTTYHFLGRRHTGCYVNYSIGSSNTPPSFLLFPVG